MAFVVFFGVTLLRLVRSRPGGGLAWFTGIAVPPPKSCPGTCGGMAMPRPTALGRTAFAKAAAALQFGGIIGGGTTPRSRGAL